MTNRFQGNRYITNAIIQGLELTPDDLKGAWFYHPPFDSKGGYSSNITQTYYTDAFHYLTRRFGPGEGYEDIDNALFWDLNFKGYTFRIYFRNAHFEIMVFTPTEAKGVYSQFDMYRRAKWRMHEKAKKLSKYIPIEYKGLAFSFIINTDLRGDLFYKMINETLVEMGIPENQYKTLEEMEQKALSDYDTLIEKVYDKVNAHNATLLSGEQYLNQLSELEPLWDERTLNVKTRNTLKIVRQFCQNMLKPIWIGDVGYNIKGRIPEPEAIRLDGLWANRRHDTQRLSI